MTHEQFMTAAIEIADGCSIFIDDNFYQHDSSRAVSINFVYRDTEAEHGVSCKSTEQYTDHAGVIIENRETRYQSCLMDLKLIIFNAQKAKGNAWRDENEAA